MQRQRRADAAAAGTRAATGKFFDLLFRRLDAELFHVDRHADLVIELLHRRDARQRSLLVRRFFLDAHDVHGVADETVHVVFQDVARPGRPDPEDAWRSRRRRCRSR